MRQLIMGRLIWVYTVCKIRVIWIFEPHCEKTYFFWHLRPTKTLNSLRRMRCLIGVFVVAWKILYMYPWLFKMCPVEMLIRLRESTGWSDSLLGAYVRRGHFLTLRLKWCKMKPYTDYLKTVIRTIWGEKEEERRSRKKMMKKEKGEADLNDVW